MKDDKIPKDSVKVVTMLKLEDGVVIDSQELTEEQRIAYIEFAIHLAAPKLAKLLSETSIGTTNKENTSNVANEALFKYPAMMTVKQAAEFLNVSDSTVREMERRWHGKFFPAVRMGNSIRIPRDELVQWIKDGGINKYRDEVARADAEYEEEKRKMFNQTSRRSISPKIKQ